MPTALVVYWSQEGSVSAAIDVALPNSVKLFLNLHLFLLRIDKTVVKPFI